MPPLDPNIPLRQETATLTDEEYHLLVMRRGNYLFAAIAAYLAAILGLFGLWRSDRGGMDPDNKAFRVNFSKSELESYQDSIPWLLVFLFLASSAFFIYFIIHSIRPLFRDTAQRKKYLIYFHPVVEPGSQGKPHRLRLPFEKECWIDISAEQYDLLKGEDNICLCTTSHTRNPIWLMAGERPIRNWG